MIFDELKKLVYYRRMFLGYHLFNDGRSFDPGLVGLMPTARCNLRCRMCAQWGENGYFNVEASQWFMSQELPVQRWKQVIDNVSRHGTSVFVWGGEPFMYQGIMDLLTYIKRKGLHCFIITNGTLLLPFASRITEIGINEIEFSLDGPPDVNDMIRGKGVFDKVTESIKAVHEARAKLGSRIPRLVINTVITRESYRAVPDMVELAKKMDLDGVNFVYAWNIPDSMGEAYERICQKEFGIKAPSWRGYRQNEIDVDLDELSKIIKKIQSLDTGELKIHFLPDLSYSEIRDHYLCKSNTAHKKCLSLWYRGDIRYNGDVVFCGDFPDYVLGNIRDEDFLSIWNNDKARSFRKAVKKAGILPICSRCCNLYEYNLFRP